MSEGINSEERKSMMTPEWAKKYPEYYGYYYKAVPLGKCACDGRNIAHRHIVRSPISGDVVEIGWVCYGHWCEYHGEPTDPEFVHYKAQKSIAKRAVSSRISTRARKHPGQKIPPEDVRAEYNWALEQQRIAKLHQEHTMIRVDVPRSKFANQAEADQWAKDRNGFGATPLMMRGDPIWIVMLPEEVAKKVMLES